MYIYIYREREIANFLLAGASNTPPPIPKGGYEAPAGLFQCLYIAKHGQTIIHIARSSGNNVISG